VRIICAWCRRVLQEGPADKVSHGCCDECFKKQITAIDQEAA
jgi:hypothetical protein